MDRKPKIHNPQSKIAAAEATAIDMLARRIAKKLVPAGDAATSIQIAGSANPYRRTCAHAAGLVLGGWLDEAALWALVADSRRERPSSPVKAFEGKIVLITAAHLNSEMKWTERLKTLLVPSVN